MLYGLRNVGGYEPLILERYSRALGGVWMDATTPLTGFKPNIALFEPLLACPRHTMYDVRRELCRSLT